MGGKAKEAKVEYGRPIYASEPAPIKEKAIIPIEDDGKPSPDVYVIVNLNVRNAHGGHCGE